MLCREMPAYAQRVKSNNSALSPHSLNIFPGDTGRNQVRFAELKNKRNAITGNRKADADLCNTSTYFSHIAAPAGKQIELKDIETARDGNYIVLGNIILPANKREGFIAVLDNVGNIVSSRIITVGNNATALFGCKMKSSGDFVITGLVDDGNNTIFAATLESTLSLRWLQTIQCPSQPVKTTIDIGEFDEVLVAAQLGSAIQYASFDKDGTFRWRWDVAPQGLVELVGFRALYGGIYCLMNNSLRNGLMVTEMVEISQQTGAVNSVYTKGNGEENKFITLGTYSGRLLTTGIRKDIGNQFKLERDIFYYSSEIETSHTYTMPIAVDFNCSAALDNAGDAIGLCNPSLGKLVYLKHFAYYGMRVQVSQEYNVPIGSSVTAIARSFDGGYLFGLNTAGNNEFLLLKTDSIGTVQGCSGQSLSVTSQEILKISNISSGAAVQNVATTVVAQTIGTGTLSLSPRFDCRQNYCPPAPIADTCFSTYYKTFRSGSYSDGFGPIYLMRNKRFVTHSARLDRVVGIYPEVTTGLRLLDEAGNFIKGVDVYLRDVSASFGSFQMDDKSIMMVHNASTTNTSAWTLTLVSDNLDILWTKSFESDGAQFYFGGSGVGDIHKDAEGNYYIVGTGLGYMEKPSVTVIKLDGSGNTVWLKKYALDKGWLGAVSVVSTASSVVAIIDGSNEGAVSVRLDKNTGQLLNSYIFAPTDAGYAYRRCVKYDQGQIFYAGDLQDNILLARFDSTGKPIGMRSIPQSSVPRAADVRNGNLYVQYYYYNGTKNIEVLLKVDTGLHVTMMQEYPFEDITMISNMAVSADEDIYLSGGIVVPDTYDSYAFLKKYNKNGEIGTCSHTPKIPTLVDIDPNPQPLGSAPLTVSINPILVAITFEPAKQNIFLSQILCSSAPQCTSISIAGPDSLCNIADSVEYKITKPLGCLLQPSWIYDTASAKLKSTTDTSAVFAFKKAGNVQLEATLDAGCIKVTDTLTVIIQPAENFTLGNDTLICPGDTLRLSPGNYFNSYLWQDLSTDSVFTATQPGLYTTKVTNSCGDELKDTLLLTFGIVPPLSIGADTTVCALSPYNIKASSGFITYNWNAPDLVQQQDASATLIPHNPQNVIVRALTVDGCAAGDTLNLQTITVIPIHLGNDTSFCTGGSVVLSAGSGYGVYEWSTGSGNEMITAQTAGTYWIKATDNNGCITRDSLVINTVFPLPSINLGKDFDVCAGSTVQLSAGNFQSYLWMDGSTASKYNVSTTGTYWVEVQDQHKCTNRDTVLVKNELRPPSKFLPAVDSLCQYESIELGANKRFASYHWSTGSPLPTITVSDAGSYMLTVTDDQGCSGSDTTLVIEKACMSGLFIPSAFTPNRDKLNDVFKAKAFGIVVSFRLEVHNRFGEIVFFTTDPKKGWDGTLNGIEVPSGIFVWQCFCTFEGGAPLYRKGTVTLIR
ncbi:MAG: gliding motility-associated C-terminal domain-containing protein [Chitinophagaceae bacterium]|nr:gliding motility-associated C-terminal domain-containing protein [Chitinophagaceae bacterium]